MILHYIELNERVDAFMFPLLSFADVFMSSHPWKSCKTTFVACFEGNAAIHWRGKAHIFMPCLETNQCRPHSHRDRELPSRKSDVDSRGTVLSAFTNSMPCACHMFTIEWGGEWWDQELDYWILNSMFVLEGFATYESGTWVWTALLTPTASLSDSARFSLEAHPEATHSIASLSFCLNPHF